MSKAFKVRYLAAFSAVLVVLGCAGRPEDVRIGLIAMLTGTNSGNGRAMSEAASLAVSQANAAGGLLFGKARHKVVLKVEDDRDSPEAALAAARKLVYAEKVAALVGPQFSANAIPVARFAESEAVVMVAPMSTNPETTAGKRFVFRIPYLDTFQGTVLARFARSELKARTAAVLYDVSGDYSKVLAGVFCDGFEKDGGAVVVSETYTATQNTDFTRQLKRIARLKPDVLVLPNYQVDVERQGEQARAMGITAVFLGGDGWDPRYFRNTRPFEGSYVTRHWDPSVTTPAAQSFLAAFQKTWGEVPDDVAATTYDAVRLLFIGIEEAGSNQGDLVRRSISSMRDFQGVTGTIGYVGSGDPVKSALVLGFKNGKGAVDAVVNP